ncbi:DegV family protein with EDD domain [Alkalibacillus filiformis]|uniref:DegV family protein with EDD domain n=1 Tax=Alkalibacillus filiformis TaxID=200990 RepID=A0ABU0DWZ1_9BACI|nr:DegV family protein [Alkalibacillus filiformis]MDQ0352968.1 DegV family protein with EDD domain [Alkalibacillus filiformis]
MGIQFMVDGGADLPQGFAEKFNIKEIPLNIHFNDGVYKAGVELTTDQYYEKFNAMEDIPKTSAPSPNDFYEAFKEVDTNTPILLLSLTKNLSATYQNAVIGRDMILDEEPDREIEIVNTKTASCGVTLLLNEAIKMKLKNVDFHEIVNQTKENVEKTVTLFSLKTVENLIKGGRLDKFRGTIAKTLNIKLLMKASDEGEIEVTEKIRGEKKALRRLIEQIGEYSKTLEGKTIVMSQGNCESRAQKLMSQIKEQYNQEEDYTVEMGPLVANYAGEGGIVISFLEDDQ